MELNDLELERVKKLERLREQGIDPYPARVERTHTNQQVIAAFNAAEADPTQGKISNESPLGKALLGRRVGDSVQVSAPAGLLTFRIAAIK